jgi:hypothetical protein
MNANNFRQGTEKVEFRGRALTIPKTPDLPENKKGEGNVPFTLL